LLIPTPMRAVPLSRPSQVATTAARTNIGSHADRQSRFDARSRRRYGDWSLLDIPLALLWLDEVDNDIPDPDNPSPY
jgi:predicted alpha/beta hydrolase